MNEKKPKVVSNLKIIEYIGSLYVTFDGTTIWEMDRLAYEVLKLCDGKHTIDDIAQELAKAAELPIEDVKTAIKPIFEELEKLKFIEYV